MTTNGTSIVRRIPGTVYATGAHEAFFLDDPRKVYQVVEGGLDVFVAETFRGTALRRRPFVDRVPEGSMAFGGIRQPGDHELDRFSFVGVPSRNAVIVAGERADLGVDAGYDLDSVVWVDDWIVRICAFMARAGRLPPRDTLRLEAKPDIPYPGGATLSAQHSDIIWVTADCPFRILGREDLVIVPGGPPVPLTEMSWIQLEENARVSALYTPSVFLSGGVWPALDLFNMFVQEFAASVWSEQLERERERYRSAVSARRASVAASLGRVGSVLGTDVVREDHQALGLTPLQAAVRLVAEAEGADLGVSSGGDDGPPMDVVPALARASGIRTRKIALGHRWWRRDGASFVGLTREGNHPIALIAKGRAGFRAVDTTAGTEVKVGRREAAELLPHGMTLYAPFPARVTDAYAVLRHAFRGRGRDIRTVVAMGILSGLLSLLTPVVTGKLLGEVLPRVDHSMWISMLGALLVGAVGAAMFEIVRALAMLRIESRVDERLQAAIWNRLLSLPAAFFRGYSAGDLADRANGVGEIRQQLTGATATAVVSGIFSLFSFALLFYYSWRLALVAMGIVGILVAATTIFARAQMTHLRAAFFARGVVDGFVFQMLNGLTKLRSANAEAFALGRWAEHFAEQRRETLAARRWMAGHLAFNAMFTPLALLGIFAVIWHMLINGPEEIIFSLADFLSFNAAFGQFAAAMTAFGTAVTAAMACVPLYERVKPILDAEPETVTGGIDPGELTGEIEFTNVTFRYLPEAPNAVEEISLRVTPGEFVAFVGPSGSGKSTLYRLLLGFEHPDSGAVLLDGHSVSSLDLPAVRSRLGVVMQNGRIVAASVFKNIASTTSLTMEEAWAAARAAGLAEDIEAMPMGMHTVLPEGGGLSGGQKQRLLIARALARKPRIVLFDEATSALDNRTQDIVQQSLKMLSTTRLIIAHRLSTIEEADRIYVMERGRIVEVGRYQELMNRNGVFAAIARRQTF